MTRYLATTSPAKTGFNQNDIKQIVDGMFDENKTPFTVLNVESHGRVLEVSFTNKNPDGSSKKETRIFATNEAADAATQIVDDMVKRQRGSFSFDAAPSGLALRKAVA